MKSIFIFFIGLLSLSVFYGCGDTEDADLPNPIVETEAEVNIPATPPDEDMDRPDRRVCRRTYGTGDPSKLYGAKRP